VNARQNAVYLPEPPLTDPAYFEDDDAMHPDILRSIAEDAACQDFAAIVEWLQCDHGERQTSAYFGPISTEEIVLLMLGGRINAEQALACCRELRRRFIAENEDFIDDKAKEMAHG
jgi:hypothetical protein